MSEPRTVLSGHLSKDATFSLSVSGPFDLKEIDRLIEHLNLIRSFFIDDEESEVETPPSLRVA